LETIRRVPSEKAAPRIGEACSYGWNGFAGEHLCCGLPCGGLGGAGQRPGCLSCRAAPSQLFSGENDDGLAEYRWCNLSYRFGAGCAACEEKPFWPSSVEHQSLEILSEAAEYAL